MTNWKINARFLITIFASWLVLACQPATETVAAKKTTEQKSKQQQISAPERYTDYVDPFIGTGGHGHTFPGATVPFGMVQLSPDNKSKGWDWTSGYHYSDNQILGFSHTHLSGTGVGDLLDILVTPFISEFPANMANDVEHVYAEYSHEDEVAEPGYYAVNFKNEGIKAELTSTARVGVHRYQFPANKPAQLLFDLSFAQNWDKAVSGYFRVEDEYTLVGHRLSTGWAKHQPVYFVAKFNKPFAHQLYADMKKQGGKVLVTDKAHAVLNFGELKSEALVVKVGLSYASIEGARKNIAEEVAHFDFELVKQQASDLWQQQLAKIQVKDDNRENKVKFYTALYHSYIAPHLFEDANHEYHGADGSTKTAKDYQRYTLFSLWDTFRTLHPMLTITNPDKVDDMVLSMLAFYDEYGLLPTWDLMANETDVMIGYHAVPVIVDAYFKGLTSADPERIYLAIKTSAMQDNFGLNLFKEHGYIPSELEYEAVSKVLEYGFDDWAIARMAKHLGKEQDYQYFIERSQAYNKIFDKETGFMRGKDINGEWVTPFDPTYVEHRTSDYTEANAWQYTWFVPHDVPGLISLFGSEQAFVSKLDELFTTSSEMSGDVSPDISGMIGQYAHGNEPCHHIPYLYAFTSQPWKGEERIKNIRNTMYRSNPDGLAGNDDVGQMSAWFVMSSMGFYPVNPASGEYVVGTPLFDEVTIKLANDKEFKITTQGENKDKIQSISVNGKQLTERKFNHKTLMAGGELNFTF